MRIKKIEWLDSCGTTVSWEHKEDIKPILPSRCYSVGYVLDETDEYITLLQSDSNDQILGRITIPRCCIVDSCNLVDERPAEKE